MKNLLKISLILLVFASCNKIEKPVVPGISSDLSTDLYPGDWQTYIDTKWPTFTENTNTNRNVLIEDYTGHKCLNCPEAATIAVSIATANPGRVFIASVHAGPDPATGLGSFQTTNEEFTHVFYNSTSEAYGKEFATGFGFAGNPRGNVNRKAFPPGEMFTSFSVWESNANSEISDNVLKVNLQSEANYFASTKGLFLHVEADIIDQTLIDSIKVVTYFVQDEFIAPQKLPDGSIDEDYHHHDIVRGNVEIDNTSNPWGRKLNSDNLVKDETSKYRLDYSYKIDDSYTAEECHVLIYAYNINTYEIYQVIEQKISE